MIKKAIILAAGKGSRMGELGEHTPKPLLKVNSQSIMEYVVNLLLHHGVKEIGVNLHHHAHQIRDYFGTGSRYGANFTYIVEENLSGTAGGLLKVAKEMQLDQDFFVISADMLVNFDLSVLAKTHLNNKAIATLSCFKRPRDQLSKSGLVLFNETSQKLVQFLERPKTEAEIISEWVNSSVYAFSPKIIQFIEEHFGTQANIDIPKDIVPSLLKDKSPVYCQPFNSPQYYQLGVDSPDRIERAENDIKIGKFIPIKAQSSG